MLFGNRRQLVLLIITLLAGVVSSHAQLNPSLTKAPPAKSRPAPTLAPLSPSNSANGATSITWRAQPTLPGATSTAAVTTSGAQVVRSISFLQGQKPDAALPSLLKSKCTDCTWTVEPWLVPGMAIDPDGAFVGTPSHVVSFQATVTASRPHGIALDPNDPLRAPAKVTIQVLLVASPTILSGSLPSQPVNEAYYEYLTVHESPEAHYVWNIDPSTLPPGLVANANGVISGKPTTAGTYQISATATDDSNRSQTMKIGAEILDSPGCNAAKYTDGSYFKGFVPLSHKVNVDPYGAGVYSNMTDSDVQCFYSTGGPTAAITQVQYIYGFGSGANTLSSDLVSFQLFAPLGTQISLGTSVTGSSSSTNASTTTTSSTNASSRGAATTSTPSDTTTATALQTVEAGGNFFIHVLYPVLYEKTTHASLVAALDPKVGFNFNGFGQQATLTQGTEQYFNFPLDVNASVNGIANLGGLFFDYRGGLESVPGGFAENAGLSHHNFYLNQVSFGVKFAGLLQIGAQRFFGPSAAFDTTSPSGFNKWHLILQLSPKT